MFRTFLKSDVRWWKDRKTYLIFVYMRKLNIYIYLQKGCEKSDRRYFEENSNYIWL